MNARHIFVPLAAGALAMIALLGVPSDRVAAPSAHAQERPTLTPSPAPPPPTVAPTRRPREEDHDPTATPTATATPEPPTPEPQATAGPPTAVPPAELPRTGVSDTTAPLLTLVAGLAALFAGLWLARRRWRL